MSEFKERIDALAALMEEYRLTEAALEDGPYRVSFRRHGAPTAVASTSGPMDVSMDLMDDMETEATVAVPIAPVGLPVTTPMNGIFYNAPSPASPPFVKEGDSVTVGQVVGLIEAMKVFNEIPSPVSGTIKKIVAESGAVVNVGDTLLIVG